MEKLDSKIAIVTGANSGMGMATVEALSDMGATDDSVKNISGEYFYKCKIASSSKKSKDMELAKRLYKLSENLVQQSK